MVEAHFRILDPLLSLWEEVDVATGRRVRFRLGPFWIDNTGGSAREHCLRPGDVAAAHLRIPMWQFPFPRADLRYLAEWSLLRSGCLERSLPDHDGPSAGASSCCIPPMLFRRPSIRRQGASHRRFRGESREEHGKKAVPVLGQRGPIRALRDLQGHSRSGRPSA